MQHAPDRGQSIGATAALLVGLLATTLAAQSTPQVIDIDRQPAPNGSSDPRTFAIVGSQTFFVARTPRYGQELYVTLGQPGTTHLVADILPGPLDSQIREITAYGGKAYFAASRTPQGSTTTVWRSDGTAAGTYEVAPGQVYGGTNLTAAAGYLFFVASDGEPWRTDGTAAGTIQLADIAPGPYTPSSPRDLHSFKNGVLFSADDGTNGRELWFSDGTPAGTVLVKDIAVGPGDSSPAAFETLGNVALFSAHTTASGVELWRTDGTAAGTTMVVDLVPGAASSGPGELTRLGTIVLFTATTPQAGTELWRTDGTAAGTSLVLDIAPGSASSALHELIASNNQVFLVANGGTHFDLWRTDGTAAGTLPMGLPSLTLAGPAFVAAGGLLFFGTVDPQNGIELWRSDGTPAGTFSIDLQPGASSGFYGAIGTLGATAAGNALFSGSDGTTGYELWSSGGTRVSTFLVEDIDVPPPGANGSSSPQDLVDAGGITYFTADDGVVGRELWRTDGTAAGTVLVADIQPGPASSSIKHLTPAGGQLFFTADDGTHGEELWVTDGTPAGTRMSDIWPGASSSQPYSLTALHGKVFLRANDGVHGAELWVSDGTTAGTTMVLDGVTGPGGPGPDSITAFGDRVFYSYWTGANGLELWSSDGTAAGTHIVADVAPGSASSRAYPVGALDDVLLFAADDGVAGMELWRTDGTALNTFLVRDLTPGPTGSQIGAPETVYGAARLGDRLLFFADDTSSGWFELWVTNGTTVGTQKLLAATGNATVVQSSLEVVGSYGLLTAGAGTTQLWRTDGTPTGTFPLTSLPMASSAGSAVGSGSRFGWFPASVAGTPQLRVTDGTLGGTGPVFTAPYGLVGPMAANEGKLLFAATNPLLGNELFVLDVGATSQSIGQSCASTGHQVSLFASDPVLGGVMTLSGTHAIAGSAVVVLASLPPTQPRPVPRTPCLAHIDLGSVTTLAPVMPYLPSWQTQLPIPFDPALTGITLAMQAVQGPAATPIGGELSNGVRVTLGR